MQVVATGSQSSRWGQGPSPGAMDGSHLGENLPTPAGMGVLGVEMAQSRGVMKPEHLPPSEDKAPCLCVRVLGT